MISRTGYGGSLLLMLLASVSLMSVRASAQTPMSSLQNAAPLPKAAPWPDQDDAAESADADDAEPADKKDSDIKGLELDWSQLNVDSTTLTSPTSKARAKPKADSAEATWSSQDKTGGASAVSVKQSLSPVLDARIGADMTVVRQGALTGSELLSEKLANGGNQPQSSGTAWAAVTGPGVGSIWDKTSVEARVDPSQDQSKLGTSLSKSIPFTDQYSLTLQNGYNVIEQGTTLVPVPGMAGRSTRNYGTEQSAKLSITETGTSFTAGQTMSTTDDKWLRKIGAEQKLFGGVSVNGSIGETAFGASNKSITAGFKKSW
jgi:hypothetical protein